jgi:chromosomal replication initiator protein
MLQLDKEGLWKEVLSELELLISKANFSTWFRNTSIADSKDGIVFVGVPNSFTQEWIKNKYHKHIIKTIRKIEPSIRTVEYTICSKSAPVYKKASVKYKPTVIETKEIPQLGFNEFYETEESLNTRYTLENFIVGSFNELAHAAAIAVTKNVGKLYNPLFVYGGVGLGKTHLLQAVGNKIKEANPNLKAKYITSEKFANSLIQSIQNNQTYEFKETYKKYDILIIDDVQFLAGKQKTQEEFFHIFNTLYESNKQIVFSSDRPPKSIQDLEERLRSRFEGGMMADISEPDLESRIAILRSKTQVRNIVLSDEILEYIASTIKNNIRELEGALNLIGAQVKLLNKNLTLSETKEILNKNTSSRKKVTFNRIVKTVSEFYEIEEQNLFEKSRRKEYVLPRQIAMYLLREDFNGSYPYIGQKFGGRDHTTVIHAYEKISRDLKNDQELKDRLQKIREILYENVS